jgi:ATP-dependent exoDNAse (exonuclease V) alpha subunit
MPLKLRYNFAPERKIERFGWTFSPGDKVMQIENDYDGEVYNDDIGYVNDVEPDDGDPVPQTVGPPQSASVIRPQGRYSLLNPSRAAAPERSNCCSAMSRFQTSNARACPKAT